MIWIIYAALLSPRSFMRGWRSGHGLHDASRYGRGRAVAEIREQRDGTWRCSMYWKPLPRAERRRARRGER